MFNFLAVDIGAGSGRIMRCVLDGETLSLNEISRFKNAPFMDGETMRWNVTRLAADVKKGLAGAAAQMKPDAVAVDTWGVDYVFLDKDMRLMEEPVCYRDTATVGLPEEFNPKFGEERLRSVSGLQIMNINTLYQLYARFKKDPDYAKDVRRMLFIPDYIAYLLSGKDENEFTVSTTSQMLDCRTRDWSQEILDAVGLPRRCLKKPVEPGTVLGTADFSGIPGLEGVPVVMVGSHDTASAVAASPADMAGDDWAYVASGTWCLTGCEAEKAYPTPLAAKLNFTNEGGVAGTWRILKNITGFWILRALKSELAPDASYDDIMKQASEAPAHGSVFDPNAKEFFNPDSMKDAVDAFMKRTGQPLPPTTGGYIRSFLESLCLAVTTAVRNSDAITGRHTKVIHILGGGAQNPTLCAMLASASGCKVAAGPVEATALGNAVMQATAVKKISSLQEARKMISSSFEVKTFSPVRDDGWENAFRKFDTL